MPIETKFFPAKRSIVWELVFSGRRRLAILIRRKPVQISHAIARILLGETARKAKELRTITCDLIPSEDIQMPDPALQLSLLSRLTIFLYHAESQLF